MRSSGQNDLVWRVEGTPQLSVSLAIVIERLGGTWGNHALRHEAPA